MKKKNMIKEIFHVTCFVNGKIMVSVTTNQTKFDEEQNLRHMYVWLYSATFASRVSESSGGRGKLCECDKNRTLDICMCGCILRLLLPESVKARGEGASCVNVIRRGTFPSHIVQSETGYCTDEEIERMSPDKRFSVAESLRAVQIFS
jgi:hypothetical protein